MGFKQYKELIDLGFSTEEHLEKFIELIAYDEHLNDRMYEILRYLAIKEFYKGE